MRVLGNYKTRVIKVFYIKGNFDFFSLKFRLGPSACLPLSGENPHIICSGCISRCLWADICRTLLTDEIETILHIISFQFAHIQFHDEKYLIHND